MNDTLLKTKLYTPPLRPNLVSRPRLIDRLNRGLQQAYKLTLVSAAAGFGKTTLVSEWLNDLQLDATGQSDTPRSRSANRIAWLSLDEDDGDPNRFLTYLVAALQKIAPSLGEGILAALQSPQPPPSDTVLTAVLNELTALQDNAILILDDYHVVDSQPVDQALTFLLDHLPPQLHLVITTREDPDLPLARLRVRGQLTELRAIDLRFTSAEALAFLNQVMGLNLSAENVAALESRTEGWIAGLQLAALSMQGQNDAAGFIESFTGSHRFVLDYLVEEVLHRQSATVQKFLLHTSILDRLCGPLCDAVCFGSAETGGHDSAATGQEILDSLERANLFLVSLDNERRWYRYHHLFAELLRRRLHQNSEEHDIVQLHSRASAWYEENGLALEAFHHAVAANDVDRAARLIEGEGMPLHFRGVIAPVVNWLETLPEAVFHARPSLWVMYASALMMTGQAQHRVEEILQAAESDLKNGAPDEKTKDLIGHIAAIRAMLAVPQNRVETIITQSRRALELLHPDNLPVRTTTTWALGYAYQVQGERAAAAQAYREAIANSQGSGNVMAILAATTCLGQVQESETHLHQAAKSYRRILQLVGDPPWPTACESYLGLARVSYQWNDLAAAEQYGQKSMHLAQQLENVDTPAAGGILLARLKLAQGDVTGAAALIAETEQFVLQHEFDHLRDEVTAVHIQTLLRQDNLAAAAELAQAHDLPISQARIHLAQGDPSAAMAVLEPQRREVEAKGWIDERLKVMVVQAIAQHARGETEEAVQMLENALALAAPGGLIRLFLDEGPPMAALLREAAKRGVVPDHVRQLLAAFAEVEGETAVNQQSVSQPPTAQPLPDPLTNRELEVLRLLGTALSGPEIARELTVSLNTIRTHTKNIYSKLGVNSRRTAVRRAEELNLL